MFSWECFPKGKWHWYSIVQYWFRAIWLALNWVFDSLKLARWLPELLVNDGSGASLTQHRCWWSQGKWSTKPPPCWWRRQYWTNLEKTSSIQVYALAPQKPKLLMFVSILDGWLGSPLVCLNWISFCAFDYETCLCDDHIRPLLSSDDLNRNRKIIEIFFLNSRRVLMIQTPSIRFEPLISDASTISRTFNHDSSI